MPGRAPNDTGNSGQSTGDYGELTQVGRTPAMFKLVGSVSVRMSPADPERSFDLSDTAVVGCSDWGLMFPGRAVFGGKLGYVSCFDAGGCRHERSVADTGATDSAD